MRQGGRGHARVESLDHPLCSERPAPLFCYELRVSRMVVPVEALWVRRTKTAGRSVSRLPGLAAAQCLPWALLPALPCLAHFLSLMTQSLGSM